MKKIASILFIALMPLMVFAGDYTEGKQYTEISNKVSSKVEVREYFSFYCPHCLKFEPFMATVKKQLPKDVSFVRNHVDFLRAASPEVQQMLSKALVIAQQLKIEDKIVAAIFNHIQVKKASVSSIDDVRKLFELNGVAGDKFDKLSTSFSVNSKVKKMKNNQENLTKKRALNSVPTIVVNGKYRINIKALDRNNFEQDYHNLINHLLSLG